MTELRLHYLFPVLAEDFAVLFVVSLSCSFDYQVGLVSFLACRYIYSPCVSLVALSVAVVPGFHFVSFIKTPAVRSSSPHIRPSSSIAPVIE